MLTTTGTQLVDSRATLDRVDELLQARYQSADLGNVTDPLAELVYILLSQQTRERSYRAVFESVRRRFPTWNDVRLADRHVVEAVLAPAGFQRRRAFYLQGMLDVIHEWNVFRGLGPAATPPGDLTLDFLHELSDSDAEHLLMALPGIGHKSASCVLSYALDRPAFAVDTHVRRVLSRLGLVSASGRGKELGLQSDIKTQARRRLHINLIHHGRAICRSSSPRCGDCILISFCPTGRNTALPTPAKPVAVDLFSGVGGLGTGFARAGFDVALAVDSDRHAAQTYRFNHPGVPVLEEAIGGSVTGARLRAFRPGLDRVDAVLAGPPCQGYSAAGPRRADDPRNGLYTHVVRLAEELEAATVVVENVPGVRRSKGRSFLPAIRRQFEKVGYRVTVVLLDASEFGVPQRRKRYFLMVYNPERVGVPQEPAPTHVPPGNGRFGARLPTTPRLIDAIAPLAAPGNTPGSSDVLAPTGLVIHNMETMRHSAEVVEKIRRIGPGEGPISYRRLEEDVARTIIAGHRALPFHPTLHRTITVREAAVIQGFELEYRFLGPRSEQPLQVANAVPPPLAEAVAREIRRVLLEDPIEGYSRLSRRLGDGDIHQQEAPQPTR